jgi:LysM repeat protein
MGAPEGGAAMPDSEQNPADVIASYRRRRTRTVPLIMGGTAVVLLVAGVFLVVMWITGDHPPQMPAFLASKTPTPTDTATPLPPTDTPTVSLTPTITDTPTPSGPVTYKVVEGDTLFSIAQQFAIDLDVLLAYNPDLQDAGTIFVGEEITIPPPSAELPTETALPSTLIPGSKIEYIVRQGDSLQTIASKFNSTAEAIAQENDITDPNAIQAGTKLIVPVNIATPTPTWTISPTPAPGTASPSPTAS